MKSMITLGYYRPELYSELVAVLTSCNLYDEPWETEKNLRLKIERDPESIIVALDDVKLIGCVFVVVDGWVGMVWRLAVLPEYRKHGVGGMLLEQAELIVKDRGVKEVSLFVSASNNELKEWYAKRKYTIGEDYTFAYKEV